jgi:micrococcal nuclease
MNKFIAWFSAFSLLFGCYMLGAFVFSQLGQAKPEKNYQIIRVIDGDTVKVKVNFLPRPLKPFLNVRIYGIDTPEKGHRAKCSKERILAGKAKRFIEQKLKEAKSVKVSFMKWDKFGGRVLGSINIDGQNLAAMLVSEGLAVMYFGKGPKYDWCQ